MLIVRIFPYSAAQLAANDTYKRVSIAWEEGFLLHNFQPLADAASSLCFSVGILPPGHMQMLADPETHQLTVAHRLLAGACAGMTATALTHPLDTVRLRLALPNHPYKGAT